MQTILKNPESQNGEYTMLINCTNHPYEIWNDAQRKAAAAYGEVLDMPFPQIDPKLEQQLR